MALPELPTNFHMHTRTSRRGAIGMFAYLTGLTVAAYYVGDYAMRIWQGNEPMWGKPVELDGQQNPIERYAKLTPLDSDSLIPVRQQPSGNSVLIRQVPQIDHVAVVEVYGDQYRSLDNRGRHHSRNVLGATLYYGQWFQVHIDGILGYISGNFVTILRENELPQEENANNGSA